MLQDRSLSQPETPADLDDVHQAGAVCLRRDRKGQIRVLLVGSRRSGRWGLPKGHIEPGENSRSAAQREAFEEAGVTGVVSDEVFGTFTYFKDGSRNRYRVKVHLLEALSVAESFPEKSIRKTRWFSMKGAIREAAQPGLQKLLQKLL
ncbi:NUDIX hydrolase [Rhizobium mongolense]